MISRIFISIILATAFLSVLLLAADSNIGKQDINTLPWEIIAEKFDVKEPFCTASNKDGKTINFTLTPEALTLTLPPSIKIPEKQIEAELNLSIWQYDHWADLSPLAVRIEPDGLTINSKAITEGFYNMSVVLDKNNFGKENKFHAIVTADWKKDLLVWCQKNKEQIETNPDTQVIYSSIAVSHLDNLMELVSQSPALSENILSALSTTIKANTDFENGNCPDLVNGWNKIRLKRFEGSSIEEFVVFIPETYKKSKPEAVFLHTANQRWVWLADIVQADPHASGLIEIWWLTVDNKNINWKNFEYFFNILKQKLNIDENRVYVHGDCGNGLAAMSLALNFPDRWAECSISLGNTYRHLAGNALNLPLIFVKGRHNEDFLVGYYDFALECFKYHNCRFFRHSNTLSTAQVRGSPVPTEVRDLSPYRVSYTIESLTNPSAYWIKIDGRDDENFIASIDAIVWGQSILIKTDNIDAYTLNLESAPLDCNRPVEIIENNEYLDSVAGPIFVRKSPKYENAIYVKNKTLHGPVADVFTDQYVVVWKGDESIKSIAEKLAGSGPCFSDANLSAEFVNTHNIIFVGRLEKSSRFSQITDKLPVIIEDGRLTANSQVYEGDLGAIFVYPNPLNSERYLAIFSGTTEKALNLLNSAWGQIKSRDNADIGIFKVSENDRIDWLICEKFNTVWNWHESWDVPLLKFTGTYPKWKWHQWVAHILRKQLNADVMISEDPFNSAELPDKGELTLRDIARIFANDWIVKIRLKGSNLKDILMVPFNDTSSRQVSALAIDGTSLVKQPADSNTIPINEIETDRFYTVALPYKAVNGKRMGMLIKNYRMEDQGFLMSLLRDYLKENNDINLDTELGCIQLNIF